ncbi:type-F conjugative transfer system mating-pair stabilization protein TraN [Enterobacter bugandensis]|uniref:type-F conjugative transfer system mating-pair stabilization protein TraN n=1 Tax=Enterobacter bugandensis TaxID=881260 RepID=UPI00200468D1|nr:type-F conjugative transfer system mating-pair stabilization protein TraN [Enterobacter bugandensis]MCK6879761.1 type-F conjugative transfer system mating-pair stabilization protein TraN [Enterobacter bugandensis]
MKKLLSAMLMLFPLLAGAADPAFEAGVSFGKGNASAGTGALKNPGTVTGAIPGYSTNPPEKGYYGGVDGGDGGLASKGQGALQHNDVAQSVISSGKKNPVPAIDSKAPFITNGKNAESRADGVLQGTDRQCREVTVSKTTFENYSCDKDVSSVESCIRTATPGGHLATRTTQKTFTLTAADVAFTNNGTSFSFSFNAPASGAVISAHFYWADSDVNAGEISWWGVNQSMVGDDFDWEMPGAPGTPLTKGGYLPAGTYTSVGCTSGREERCEKHIQEQIEDFKSGASGFRLILVMNTVETIFIPEVKWTSSCGLDLAKATKKASVCTSPGGNKPTRLNGQSYDVYSDCWQYTDNYVVPSGSKGTCGTLMSNPSCTAAGSDCTELTDGQCTHMSYTYQCQTTHQSGGLVCGGDYICKSGECDETNGAGSSGFDTAVAKLAGLASAAEDAKKAGSSVDVKAFTGKNMSCRKAFAGFSNCCKDSGWGQNIGLANCNDDEKALGKAKAKKITISVGERCDHKVLGACIQKSQVYCVFDGKLARIIQEQGRRDQLGVKFGSGDSPNCRGLTVTELQKIDFDKINFSDFYEDVMKNQKVPDTSAQVQQIKDRIAAQVKRQGGGK